MCTLLFRVTDTFVRSGEPEVVSAMTLEPMGSALRIVGATKMDYESKRMPQGDM